jgi:hypothetical protein
MPNPGKPAELKRKLGAKGYTTPGAVVALPMVQDVPEPPRALGDAGLELWNRTWLTGYTWLSVNTDIHLLAITCEQLDERLSLRDFVLMNPDSWRERAALRELEKSIRSNLSLLGFTPTDRMKLGIAEVKTKSKLADFMEKHG